MRPVVTNAPQKAKTPLALGSLLGGITVIADQRAKTKGVYVCQNRKARPTNDKQISNESLYICLTE